MLQYATIPFRKVKFREISFLLLFPFLLLSCSSGEAELSLSGKQAEDAYSQAISDPVQRDWAEIRNSGVLRMITHYSSNTYFLNQGMEVGFEYEMVREFTRENDLALEIVIVGADENPFELLNSGAGDVIAANYTITPERREAAAFTRPYNLVDQMIVYSADISAYPNTLEELVELQIPVSVRRNSSYYSKLMDLKDAGYDLNIQVLPSEVDTEAALLEVSNGNLIATVADDNMFNAANRYIGGLLPGPVIAERDTIAWAIRNNAPDLETQMNRFLYKHFRFTENRDRPRRSAFLNILTRRYFQESQQMAQYFNPEWQQQSLGVISPYDELIRSVADSAGVDWLLVTAMIAQESEFNPQSKSWAGAVGLMQVIPRFSQIPYDDLYDPEINIREGVRIISEHLDHYSYLDEENQWAFALATYNAGLGHVADARRLAIDRNKDPNEWENVGEALLMLMQRRYYQDARHGFARGIETVQYVKEIKNRYRTYQSIVALAEHQDQLGITGVMGNRQVMFPQ